MSSSGATRNFQEFIKGSDAFLAARPAFQSFMEDGRSTVVLASRIIVFILKVVLAATRVRARSSVRAIKVVKMSKWWKSDGRHWKRMPKKRTEASTSGTKYFSFESGFSLFENIWKTFIVKDSC
jgi:hypothetical protein